MEDPGAPGGRGRVRLVEWWIGDWPRFERIESQERKHLRCEPRSHCRTGHNGLACLTPDLFWRGPGWLD